MRISIYQPRYFPQLHYFHRMFSSDLFVLLESAQYTPSLIHTTSDGKKRDKSYQSHAPIKMDQGISLLTVPIHHAGYLPLNQTRIAYAQQWTRKHLAMIRYAYKNSPFFTRIFPQITELLSTPYTNLALLNKKTILWGIATLFEFQLSLAEITEQQINKKLITAGVRLQKIIDDPTLNIARPEGVQKGTEWTVAICQKLGATEYYHGATAQEGYMKQEYYKKYGITPVLQQWQCRECPQQFSKKGFLANLSLLDLLCNVSPKEARKVLS